MEERGKSRLFVRVVLVTSFALAALVATLAGSGAASAHEQGWDSVDSRERIDYKDYTRFDDERVFGVREWNALGGVAIRQGSSGIDLQFRDYSNCNDGVYGYLQWRRGADLLVFNACVMNRHNTIDRRGTAVHELGHALGLAHNNDGRSIMCGTCGSLPFAEPQDHDKEDYRRLWGGGSFSAARREAPEAQPSAAGTSTIKPRYAFEPDDPKKLVGGATNVFVGRVSEEESSEDAPLSGPGRKVLPRTQFSVEVLENVKGSLDGTVTVNQTGGYDEEGVKARVEGDELLEPGREYMFSTSRDKKTGWYTVVAQPFGAVPINDEEQREEVEKTFEQAEKEQIPPGPLSP